MKKINILVVFCLCLAVKASAASYFGPFLLWGVENLNGLRGPALKAIDDKSLRGIYGHAASIIIFIKNSTSNLNSENFPGLSKIMEESDWLYLPQETLPTFPLEVNENVETFVLSGSELQQDEEIATRYRDAQAIYGKKNVLGVLTTGRELSEHSRLKRDTTHVARLGDGSFIYVADGKGMLYTTSPPILTFYGKNPSENIVHILNGNVSVWSNELVVKDGVVLRLIVKFTVPETILIKFVFKQSAGYWSMNGIEVEASGNITTLTTNGTSPSAPVNFSYACGGYLRYQNNSTSLLLKSIQVQPFLQDVNTFSRAQDCVGVLSPGIASGLFVTFILCFVLTIGIIAILDIKTPDRFETRGSKPLSFIVQEAEK